MTIQEVCRRTGLSADVLRAWERRYRAVEPRRRDGSRRRCYSDEDVDRLMLLRDAVAAGHAISGLVGLDEAELRALAAANGASDNAATLAELIMLVRAHDGEGLERALRGIARRRTPEHLCDEILAPLLEEVGAYWLRDASLIAKEHLASSTVSRVLEGLIAGSPRRAGPPLLFATIPHERHVIGPLMAAAVAAQRGFQTLVPAAGAAPAEIADVARRLKVRGVGISLVYQDAEHTVRELAGMLGSIPLWIGGVKAPAGVGARVSSMREFAAVLDEL